MRMIIASVVIPAALEECLNKPSSQRLSTAEGSVKLGSSALATSCRHWIPAFAGMTSKGLFRPSLTAERVTKAFRCPCRHTRRLDASAP